MSENLRWSGVPTTYTVRYVDGSVVETRVTIPDALRWETNHGGKSLIGTPTLTAMLTCVWYSLRRQGLTDVKDFAAWSAEVDDFAQMPHAEESGDLPDPSSPAASAD